VGVHHPANALVMLEVEMLERPEGVILATCLLGHAVCDKASRRIFRGGAIRLERHHAPQTFDHLA
jgi:hypothetical protein